MSMLAEKTAKAFANTWRHGCRAYTCRPRVRVRLETSFEQYSIHLRLDCSLLGQLVYLRLFFSLLFPFLSTFCLLCILFLALLSESIQRLLERGHKLTKLYILHRQSKLYVLHMQGADP